MAAADLVVVVGQLMSVVVVVACGWLFVARVDSVWSSEVTPKRVLRPLSDGDFVSLMRSRPRSWWRRAGWRVGVLLRAMAFPP